MYCQLHLTPVKSMTKLAAMRTYFQLRCQCLRCLYVTLHSVLQHMHVLLLANTAANNLQTVLDCIPTVQSLLLLNYNHECKW